MKKLVMLCVLAVCSVCSAELSSNTVSRLARTRLGREVLREHLKQKRMEVLGLASKDQPLDAPLASVEDRRSRRMLGAARPNKKVVLKGPSLGGWEYTVTTNEQNEITKIATRGTLTVMLIWNDHIVPMKYRTKFPEMTDEQRTILCGELETPWTELDPVDPYLNPKKVEPNVTDSSITEEIREVQARGW